MDELDPNNPALRGAIQGPQPPLNPLPMPNPSQQGSIGFSPQVNSQTLPDMGPQAVPGAAPGPGGEQGDPFGAQQLIQNWEPPGAAPPQQNMLQGNNPFVPQQMWGTGGRLG